MPPFLWPRSLLFLVFSLSVEVPYYLDKRQQNDIKRNVPLVSAAVSVLLDVQQTIRLDFSLKVIQDSLNFVSIMPRRVLRFHPAD
jgi:hypothetical protein